MKTMRLFLLLITCIIGYKTPAPAADIVVVNNDNMTIEKILTELNNWDKEALRNYEDFCSGKMPSKLPTDATAVHVSDHVNKINELCFLVSWDTKKSQYFVTPVISKVTKEVRVLRILTKLNSWNKEDVKLYEMARAGKTSNILPSDLITGFVMQCQEELEKLGYVAIWNWDKSLYDVKRRP